jgi:hypothetical protein
MVEKEAETIISNEEWEKENLDHRSR